MKLLLIEDDPTTASYIVRGLEEEGHTVDHLLDGQEGLSQAMTQDYDVIIIDRMLPGTDGLTIVKTLRRSERKVPVLFLTSLGGINDRVEGLEAGGDDYLCKPFAFSELLARIHALSRRPSIKSEETLLKVGDLQIDLISRRVMRGEKEIELQPREFRLLEVLMRNKGRVVTKTMLLERVWSFHFDPRTSVVETHISRLRSKIDRPFQVELIHTVRGSGYSVYESS
ncbi:MAG: winged helix-turn-helix domain-containing protein [Hyphomicrobium sp.]